MAEDGQVQGFAPKAEPSIADLMDPVALEARLKEARARRAEALARRETERAGEADDSLVERSVATRAGPAVAFAPRPPAWLDAAQAAPDEVEAPALRSPANRVRPVLLPRSGTEAKAMPGEHPPLVAPPGAASFEDGDRAAPLARRRASPALLLFLAGLGLGAAAVAISVRPSADDASGPETVAEAVPPAGPGPSGAAPAPGTAPDPIAAASPPPVVVTAAMDSTAQEPHIGSVPAPAPLAAPASDPVPAPMAPPGAAIGALLTAATPVPRPAKLAPVAPAPVAPASVALPRKVTIHYPRSAQALATSVREKLQASGIADVEVMQIGYQIARSNVRFYHDADEAAAAGTSELLVDTLGGPLEARDFTDYPTPTVTGRIEIWLAGEPARTAAVRQAKPSTPQVNPGTTGAPTDQVREVQRILLDRLRSNP